jgi:hypothetical protein
MKLFFALFLSIANLKAAPTHLVDQAPQKITRLDKDTLLIDFGKVAFANLRLTPPTTLPTTPTSSPSPLVSFPKSTSPEFSNTPIPKGAILIDWKNEGSFTMTLTLPEGLPAKVELPAPAKSTQVLVNGQPAKAHKKNNRWVLEQDLTGTAKIRPKRS